MANLGNFSPAPDNDEIPDWFREAMKPVYAHMRSITNVCQGRIGEGNLNKEYINDVQLLDGVAQNIQTSTLKGAPQEVRLAWCSVPNAIFHWSPVDEKTFSVTASFATAPTEKIFVRLVVEGK